MSCIDIDHSYSRHWSEHYLTSYSSHALPLQKLLDYDRNIELTTSLHRVQDSRLDAEHFENSEDEIDVCNLSKINNTIGSTSWHCAEQKARMQMNECERHVASTSKNTSVTGEDWETFWEDNINRSQWGVMEAKLFNKTMKILHNEKLARLAYKGNAHEIVLRRLSVDRSAARFRSLLVEVGWQVKLTQWLHALLIENLPTSLLSYYLDIMQTLRSKVPTLIEKMIMSPGVTGAPTSTERLGILLKRPWDPAVTAVVSNMKQKLSQPILFIVVQCNTTQSSFPVSSRRLRFWNSLLSQIGKVVSVLSPSEGLESLEERKSSTVQRNAERMFNSICAKVREISSRHVNRKVVLIGWHTTSVFNCHVALNEEVSAIICLGFPIYTMFGKRGAIDDVLCELTTPTLFVVGDQASFCDINDLEDAREKTFTDAITSSLVVCGADDWLRVSENKKHKCFTTQPMIDRQILEGICDFLHKVFDPIDQEESLKSPSEAIPAFTRKRPNSTGDLRSYDAKQRRPSPHTHIQRQSSTSAQINQLLSNQKQTTGEGCESNSKLTGLSFNLQTGSVSGLMSVPGTVDDAHQKTPPDSTVKRPLTPTWKYQAEHCSPSSRSITIDLTKDPNAQLSSALSKRKTKLLQPTKSQTEAAVAAILGNDEKKTASSDIISTGSLPSTLTDILSTNTVIMSPSPSLSRYTPETTRRISATTSTLSTTSQSSTSLTIGGEMGSLSSRQAFSSRYSDFKPIRGRLNRPHSVDPSVIASRSRREDRETQQATAILEQLTSSLDADKDSDGQSTSPDPYSTEFNSTTSIKKTVTSQSKRRQLSFNLPSSRHSPVVSARAHNRSARVRTRGSRRGQSASSNPTRHKNSLTSLDADKPKQKINSSSPVVRYVLTSSGLSGVVASRGGGTRRITLMPDHGVISRSSGSTARSHTSTALVLAPGSRKIVSLSQGSVVKVTDVGGSKPSISKTASSTVNRSASISDRILGTTLTLTSSSTVPTYRLSQIRQSTGMPTKKHTTTSDTGLAVSSSHTALMDTQHNTNDRVGIPGSHFASPGSTRDNKVVAAFVPSDQAVSNETATSVRMPSLVLTKISRKSVAQEKNNISEKSNQ